eukprot:TRINITY_DN7091_c0_g1_i2.p1 TRINITY_DN7091_c0_g1~~TRINITY_DN7091_c0_g1_i2.p1  ORF type:complete len:291 (-),score=75.36 TRINITY_DN7091_c0_g1_i2:464-1336(-)
MCIRDRYQRRVHGEEVSIIKSNSEWNTEINDYQIPPFLLKDGKLKFPKISNAQGQEMMEQYKAQRKLEFIQNGANNNDDKKFSNMNQSKNGFKQVQNNQNVLKEQKTNQNYNRNQNNASLMSTPFQQQLQSQQQSQQQYENGIFQENNKYYEQFLINEKNNQIQGKQKNKSNTQKPTNTQKKINPKVLEPMDNEIRDKINYKLERNSSAYEQMKNPLSTDKTLMKQAQLNPIATTGMQNIGRYIESSTASTDQIEFPIEELRQNNLSVPKKLNRGIKLDKLNRQYMEIVE